MNLRNLTEREKDILLTHFFYYLPQDGNASAGRNNRREIGEEYPGIYNRLHDREIVKVDWVNRNETFNYGYTT